MRCLLLVGVTITSMGLEIPSAEPLSPGSRLRRKSNGGTGGAEKNNHSALLARKHRGRNSNVLSERLDDYDPARILQRRRGPNSTNSYTIKERSEFSQGSGRRSSEREMYKMPSRATVSAAQSKIVSGSPACTTGTTSGASNPKKEKFQPTQYGEGSNSPVQRKIKQWRPGRD